MSLGQLIKRISKYLKPHYLKLGTVFVITMVSTLLSLVGPKLCGQAIDAITGDGSGFTKVLGYAGVLLIVYVVSGILAYAGTILMCATTRAIVRKMRDDTFDHLTTLPVSFFDHRQAGDLLSVMSYDVDTLAEALASDLITCLKSAVMVVGSLAMMLTIAPPLVIVFAITVPLSAGLTKFITKRSRPLFRKRSAKLGELNGYVEEMISGQKTTKAYSVENRVAEKFETLNKAAVDAYTEAESIGTITGPSVNFVNNLSLTLISVIGALMYMWGYRGITAGDISSFVLYSRKFSGPINEVANIIGDLQSAMAAADRVFRLLDEPSEAPDAENAVVLSNVKGNVEISNLNFGYVPERQIIFDMNIKAKEGQVVAIVGHTGAGKTTIVNLLMRFYDQYTGQICIDGQDISMATRDSLRQAFSMVLQDTWLFTGTIYENVAYGREGVTREDVERVCKEAMIHSFITHLPQGYDTMLEDGAINISKGQRQLLTIARAMLSEAPILILDEATSNVDTRTEIRIQQAMNKLMAGKTCFVIAHRLSTIRSADCILVMEKGDIVEQGTHEELMKIPNGVYAELCSMDFKRGGD
ncbi:MAG: ABC transporter ATP-binding protein [Clostridia bacterium]|nr:ABC transporter ATP-binding protein [Clostridia bacterium]